MSGQSRGATTVAPWFGIVLGATASVLLLGIVNEWFLPEAGMLQAILIALVAALATAIAVTALLRNRRSVLNWVALAVSAPPLLFLVVFGLGEILGPSH